VVDKLYGVDKMGKRTKYLVRLTDGGVRDNQGIDGLLDAGCTDLLISDGSSPTADIEEPAGTIAAVLPRVLAIGRKESREQRVYYAFARDPDADVKFMHLQTGLQPLSLDPIDLQTPADRYQDEYSAPWPTGLDPAPSCSSPRSVRIWTPSQTWSASRSRRSATARPMQYSASPGPGPRHGRSLRCGPHSIPGRRSGPNDGY
jgi:hypothetical protein